MQRIAWAKLRSLFSNVRWQTRLAIWGGAISAGLIVVLFAKLAELAQLLFIEYVQPLGYFLLIVIPFAASLIAYITMRFFSGTQGSGIPQVIAASKLAQQSRPIHQLVSLRIAIGKVLLGFLGLLFGFSIGREGPSVQVSASVFSYFSRYLPNQRLLKPSDLILAGGAAGIAAAFNTPLAGIIFAIEELGKRLEARTSGLLLGTIIVSGFVSIGILGNYKYFGHFFVENLDVNFWKYIFIASLVCGVLGGIFSRLLLNAVRAPGLSVWVYRQKHPVFFAGLCGLLVALLGILSDGKSFGSGYGITGLVLDQNLPNFLIVLFGKYLATIASYFSGIPGGIFAPSLSIGSMIGGLIHLIFSAPSEYLVPLVAISMVGFLSAVTQAPITSAVIVMEMIDGHEMLLALLMVSLISKAVSSRISPPLYSGLANSFMKQSLASKR